MTFRLLAGLVGLLAPLRFAAESYARDQIRLRGEDPDEFPEPLIAAIASTAIAAATRDGRVDRVAMALYIQEIVTSHFGPPRTHKH